MPRELSVAYLLNLLFADDNKMLRDIVVDTFAFLALLFNGLLIYSLAVNKGSISELLWFFLVIREIFGFICFAVMYSQKWLTPQRSSFNFWFYVVYFVLLFGFALAELVIMTKHIDDAISGMLPLPVFAWFFVVIDWLVVFSIFTMGICVYDNTVPRFLQPDELDADEDDIEV
jgi:hypothetical protein